MKLTIKQMETLVGLVENMEVNFSFDEPFEAAASPDDFFNWANEEDIRAGFEGKTVSGRLSSLMKKGILSKEYAYESKWVKIRRTLVLKEIAHPLWHFTSMDVFADALGIQKGESVNNALNRMKALIA